MRLVHWLASLIHKPQPVHAPQRGLDEIDEDQLLAEVREKIEQARRELVRAEEFRRRRRESQ